MDNLFSESEKFELLAQIEANISSCEEFSDFELETLEILSKDSDAFLRSEVASLLVDFTESRGENILIQLTKDRDSLVRTEACDSLSSSCSKETFNLLMRMAKFDGNGMVRGYAVFSLGSIALKLGLAKEATNFLEERLKKEKVVFTKININRVLYSLGKTECLHSLIAELNARVYRNRCATVHCLVDMLNSEKIEKAYAVTSSIDKALEEISSKFQQVKPQPE